jgi:hypothetical protein
MENSGQYVPASFTKTYFQLKQRPPLPVSCYFRSQYYYSKSSVYSLSYQLARSLEIDKKSSWFCY